jgi:opacity protein-like surface antigen
MRIALSLLLILALTGPAFAADAVTQTLAAPVDHVWSVTLAVLKQLGWDIDKSDRSIGWITTDSRRVEGDNFGVYEKGTRHRLVLHLKDVGGNRTSVSVERTAFKRERILFVDKDEPVTTTDQSVEKSVLAAIEKSL